MNQLRGTDRTSRQIEALPPGSIYVVMHHRERGHCWRILADHNLPRDHLRIVTIDEVMQGRLAGLDRDTVMDVDHHVFEERMKDEVFDVLREWRHRFALPPRLVENDQ